MARAVLRGFWESPRKVRVVADMIRGRPVAEAQSILRMQQRKAAAMLVKVLDSAIANASENDKADADQLVVKSVAIDCGPTQKRFMPRSMGRSNRINKRTSHVTVVVDILD
jgi:large subunit ribosomal protein L22